MLSFLGDCPPLFAVISPIVVDFMFFKIKTQWVRKHGNAWEKLQTIILISLAAIAAGFILIFLAAILFFYDFKVALVIVIFILIHMVAIFAFYKLFFRVRNQKKTWGKLRVAILISLAVVIGGFLSFPLAFSFDFLKLCLAISSPIAIKMWFCTSLPSS